MVFDVSFELVFGWNRLIIDKKLALVRRIQSYELELTILLEYFVFNERTSSFEQSSCHSAIHVHFLKIKLFVALFNCDKKTVVKEAMLDQKLSVLLQNTSKFAI